MHISAPSKSTLVLPFLFPLGIFPFRIFLLILGLGGYILLPVSVGRLCVSHEEVLMIVVADVSLIWLADFGEIIHKVL